MSDEALHQDQTKTIDSAAQDENQPALLCQRTQAHLRARTHQDETWQITLRPLMSLNASIASPAGSGRR